MVELVSMKSDFAGPRYAQPQQDPLEPTGYNEIFQISVKFELLNSIWLSDLAGPCYALSWQDLWDE